MKFEVCMSKSKNNLDIFLYKSRNMSKLVISETTKEEIKSATEAIAREEIKSAIEAIARKETRTGCGKRLQKRGYRKIKITCKKKKENKAGGRILEVETCERLVYLEIKDITIEHTRKSGTAGN